MFSRDTEVRLLKCHTFEVEEHVRLVVLEHLCDELDIHVLDVDLLKMVLESYS